MPPMAVSMVVTRCRWSKTRVTTTANTAQNKPPEPLETMPRPGPPGIERYETAFSCARAWSIWS